MLFTVKQLLPFFVYLRFIFEKDCASQGFSVIFWDDMKSFK